MHEESFIRHGLVHRGSRICEHLQPLSLLPASANIQLIDLPSARTHALRGAGHRRTPFTRKPLKSPVLRHELLLARGVGVAPEGTVDFKRRCYSWDLTTIPYSSHRNRPVSTGMTAVTHLPEEKEKTRPNCLDQQISESELIFTFTLVSERLKDVFRDRATFRQALPRRCRIPQKVFNQEEIICLPAEQAAG